MIRIYIICILLLAGGIAGAQPGLFTLDGTIKGLDTGSLHLEYSDIKGNPVTASAAVKNGLFHFSGTIAGPQQASLYIGDKEPSSSDAHFTWIYLSTGKLTLQLQAENFKHLQMTGSAMQDDAMALEKQKGGNPAMESDIDLQLTALYDKRSAGDTTGFQHTEDSLRALLNRYRNEDRLTDYRFIAQHPGSYLSPLLMQYYFGAHKLPLDSAKLFYSAFTPPVKNSPDGASIGSQITARQNTSAGHAAPLFTMKDVNGQPVALGAFKGKHTVLLDFWASWCIPCRAESTQLRALYAQYHAKGFEIISISWDSKEADWKKAIIKDSTGNWHHVRGDLFAGNDAAMRMKYAIRGIPSYILIDSNGIIRGRYRGGGDELSDEDLKRDLKELMEK